MGLWLAGVAMARGFLSRIPSDNADAGGPGLTLRVAPEPLSAVRTLHLPYFSWEKKKKQKTLHRDSRARQ